MGHTEAETVESPINNIPVIQVEKDATSDHYNPTVRLMNIPKLNDGSCGFDLSRSKWDPYPWVSSIDKDSPAENSGCKVGDCVLEVQKNHDITTFNYIYRQIRSKHFILFDKLSGLILKVHSFKALRVFRFEYFLILKTYGCWRLRKQLC